MNTPWLRGWGLEVLSAEGLFDPYKEECAFIINASKIFCDLGVMPKVPGRKGRSGNIVVRDRLSNSHGFLATGSETDKEFMDIRCITLVTRVCWEEKQVYSFQDRSLGLGGDTITPTTESLIAGQVLQTNPELNVSIHFHNRKLWEDQFYKKSRIKVPYPAAKESDWRHLRDLTVRGYREIGLLGHTDPKSNELDAAFIFGSSPEETLQRAVRIINESSEAGG